MQIWKTALCTGFFLAIAAYGQAAEMLSPRVINTAPAPDAAILAVAPGFNKIEGETIIGNHYAHNEGVIIRGSRIENGKIIIPPSGLFYTNRGPRSYMMRGDVLNMLGKPYYLTYIKTQAGVLSNKLMVPGDEFRILPDKVFRLKEIKAKSNGHPTPVASFEVLRPSGVPVSKVGWVSLTPLSNDNNKFEISGKDTGMYPVEEDFRFDLGNYTSDLDAFAGKYIKTKDLNNANVFVEEALFHEAEYIYVTTTPPVTDYYAPGDSVKLGDATVKIISVNADEGSAVVELTDKAGKAVQKTLGPIPSRTMRLLTNAEWDIQNKFSLHDDAFTVQVELNPYKESGLINNGKVALNMLQDTRKFYPEMVWPTDPAYIYRPDT